MHLRMLTGVLGTKDEKICNRLELQECNMFKDADVEHTKMREIY